MCENHFAACFPSAFAGVPAPWKAGACEGYLSTASELTPILRLCTDRTIYGSNAGGLNQSKGKDGLAGRTTASRQGPYHQALGDARTGQASARFDNVCAIRLRPVQTVRCCRIQLKSGVLFGQRNVTEAVRAELTFDGRKSATRWRRTWRR